jgi:hypothetical protein
MGIRKLELFGIHANINEMISFVECEAHITPEVKNKLGRKLRPLWVYLTFEVEKQRVNLRILLPELRELLEFAEEEEKRE